MSVPKHISITDFTNPAQVLKMRKVLKATGSKRELGVGVMMSYKTLRGLPTKWSAAFPPKETIKDIFLPDEGLFNVLHYADYDHQTMAQDISDALDHAGKHVHAIQFDMPWPHIGHLSCAAYWGAFHKNPIEIILQIGRRAMAETGNDPTEVALRVYQRYGSLLSTVLLDQSGGEGIPMSPALLLSYIREIKAVRPRMNIIVAGGLSPTTMHLIDPIVKEFPDISIDAQGRLRPSGNSLDPIDWDMAADYLREGVKRLG